MTHLPEELAAGIAREFHGSKATLERFASGSYFLDVRWRNRSWVLTHQRDRFAVDELGEEEGFDTGYRFVADTFGEAADELLRVLREAARTAG